MYKYIYGSDECDYCKAIGDRFIQISESEALCTPCFRTKTAVAERTLSSIDAEELFDEYLNNHYKPMKIEHCTFLPSYVLFELDSPAYAAFFSDWLECEGITINNEVQA